MPTGRDLLLGLDVGTTATKVLLFDLQGNVVAAKTHPYGLITPQVGWVEQDPEILWHAVTVAVRSVLAQKPIQDRVVALCQASQGGTTIPLDDAGTPCGNAISWMDRRGRAQAQRIRQALGDEYIYTTTGWPVSPASPLQHISWLRENRSSELVKVSHWLFVNDFIMLRLTGQHCMNPSDATMTQMFNIATGKWDECLLAIAGIAPEQLSPVLPSGHPVGRLTEEASEVTGLPQGVLIVNGAHDQYCAAVGTGVTYPGPVLLSCGTAWVILAVPESLEVGLRSGMCISRHAIEGCWGAIRSLGGAGASLDWFLEQVWSYIEAGEGSTPGHRYDSLNQGVARSPAGANALLFRPLAGGHNIEGSGGGGFWGLLLSHTRDDMARAVMEGIAFELCWVMEEIQRVGIDVYEWKMVGGAAESSVWPQIVADITGLPVVLPTVRQAACRGAAIMAGVGAGLFPDAEAGISIFGGHETCLEPDAYNSKLYSEQFARYKEIVTNENVFE